MGRRLAPAQGALMRLAPGSRIKIWQGPRASIARACFCGRWRRDNNTVDSGRIKGSSHVLPARVAVRPRFGVAVIPTAAVLKQN